MLTAVHFGSVGAAGAVFSRLTDHGRSVHPCAQLSPRGQNFAPAEILTIRPENHFAEVLNGMHLVALLTAFVLTTLPEIPEKRNAGTFQRRRKKRTIHPKTSAGRVPARLMLCLSPAFTLSAIPIIPEMQPKKRDNSSRNSPRATRRGSDDALPSRAARPRGSAAFALSAIPIIPEMQPEKRDNSSRNSPRTYPARKRWCATLQGGSAAGIGCIYSERDSHNSRKFDLGAGRAGAAQNFTTTR
jgi:hypothetical protein